MRGYPFYVVKFPGSRWVSRPFTRKRNAEKLARGTPGATVETIRSADDIAKYAAIKNPLASGYSRETVSSNIGELRRAGFDPAVAAAIAYKSARRDYRKAHKYGGWPRYLRRIPESTNPLVRQGEKLYTDFMLRQRARVSRVRVPDPPKVGVAVGRIATIIYESNRGGAAHLYRHDFGHHSRPLLVASSDGKHLVLLGGAYRFTQRGIVDRRS